MRETPSFSDETSGIEVSLDDRGSDFPEIKRERATNDDGELLPLPSTRKPKATPSEARSWILKDLYGERRGLLRKRRRGELSADEVMYLEEIEHAINVLEIQEEKERQGEGDVLSRLERLAERLVALDD